MSDKDQLDGIAIIGMAGRFPRARDVEELWRNLRDGVDAISRFSDEEIETAVAPETLRNPLYVKARGVLDDVERFDPAFFDMSPRQAELMDPQHRLFLEHSHQALEDAGHDPERFPGLIGVFGGVTLSSYFLHHIASNPGLLESIGGYQAALGTDRDYLTTFVSYKLNLRGPSLDVQTACSTSLVATVLACQSLLSYSCDMALAGGVSIKLPQKTGYFYTPGGLDSSDGYCRAFDARADGSVYGSGVGVVVLRRLEDALADGDPVRAVILGSAMNNDGAARVGFTAPGVAGQAEAIATAQALAGVDPGSITYVECHGSGTALGDPIEVAALTKAFRGAETGAGGPGRRGFCAIGSIKSNVGHCSAAAGVAGLTKAVLALENRQIPPSLHFERPNPALNLESSPFYVAGRLADWNPNGPRRAGVSSFGLGGTNAHVVLQEAPEPEQVSPSRPWQLLVLSAKSEAALEAATDRLAGALEEKDKDGKDYKDGKDGELADVAFTLQVGRRIFPYRRTVVCRDAEEAQRLLAGRDPRRVLGSYREPGNRPVAFLLPGVGDHYPGMARGLYAAEPAFREALDRAAALFQPLLGCDLREVIFPVGAAEGEVAGNGPDLRRLLGRTPASQDEASRRLSRTLYAQPAVFAVEHALAQLWLEWGIRPDALLGYSLGEYTAASLAGVLSLEDAARLVAERARLLDGLPGGAMLAAPLAEERLRPLLGGDLDVSAVNAPGVCVVGGPEEAIAALEARLGAEGIPARRLPTTHAFHTRWMEPAAAALTRLARGLRLSPPKIPFVSNVTGAWITPAEATDPGYWARHLVQPVRFAAGLAALWKNPSRVLLEVGPGFGLSTLALQSPPAGNPDAERLALPSLRNQHDPQPDQAFLLEALGRLWLAGVAIDWSGFYAREKRRRLRLPTYPFERSRFWIEPGHGPGAGRQSSMPARPGVEDQEAPRAQAAGPVAGGRYARPALRNAYASPSSDTEARIAFIFQELLGIESVGVHDSFFELGGHSLLATQVVSRLRDRLGVELPAPILFEEPTVAGLAARVEGELGQAPAAAVPAIRRRPARAEGGGSSPLGGGRLDQGGGQEGGGLLEGNGRPASLTTGPAPLLTSPLTQPTPAQGGGTLPPGLLEDFEVFPLSFAQRGLWFLDRLEPGNPAYVLPAAVRLTGRLDRGALARSLDEVVRRHEALRVTFAVQEGEPVQRLAPSLSLSLPLVDLRALPERLRQAETGRLAHREARRPFDLETGPLLRALLLGTHQDGHALLFAMHHIASDAWSLGVLVREVAALYAAFSQGRPSPLPELPVQYLDYAGWQREHLGGEVLERQIAYWRQELADTPALDLPADRRRGTVQTFRGSYHNTAFPPAVSARFRDFCQRHGVTAFMALLALYETLLHRYTGQGAFAVGTTIANRRQTELESLIGLFVNTLALRADLAGDPPFAELLARVRRGTLDAYANQDLPFERLVQELQAGRDLSRSALFQTVFQVQNAPAGELSLPGLTLAPLEIGAEATTFDLVVSMGETPAGLVGTWRFNTDLFDAPTVVRMAAHFETLLAGALEDEDRRLSELPLLSAPERHQLLAEWVGGGESFPEGTLWDRFAARAAAKPEAVAVVSGEDRLTYGELAARARRLAGRLRSHGVGPETVVALFLERSVDLVVAVLGVLAAGGAYLPLDPTYPQERLAVIAEDAAAEVVVARAEVLERLARRKDDKDFKDSKDEKPEGAGVSLESLESLLSFATVVPIDDAPTPALDPPVIDPGSTAYVIYTSGSTGRPKGVPVRHGNVTRLFDSTDSWFRFGPGDVWTLFHSYAFDFSVWEIWGALLYGGRLVVVPQAVTRSPEDFHALLRREGVTVLNQTPSAFYGLIRADEAAPEPLSLRWVVFGGEALELASLAPWFERHGDQSPGLVNMYGITETTVHVTFRQLTRDDLSAGRGVIGRPLPDLRLWLLDRHGQPVPIGIPGEIHVGGAGVARGYLERPALTAERFVPAPFAGEDPGARAYRSGDLARWLPDGGLEYLGRIDHQVKIRGFRIELGEVEAALAAHPRVREAAAKVWEEGADRRLVAYVVPRAASELGPLHQPPASPVGAQFIAPAAVRTENGTVLAGRTDEGAMNCAPTGDAERRGVEKRWSRAEGVPCLTLSDVRAFLARILPEPMLPSALVLLDAFALTPSGKVDRKALPAPDASRPDLGGEFVAPRTDLERALTRIWSGILRIERIGVHDDFFELGGNSITAAVAVNRLQEELGSPVAVVALFEAPTVARLAERLASATAARTDWALEPLPWIPGEPVPLSFAQERLWFLERLEGPSATYNIPAALRLPGPLDVAAFARALTEITRRHAVLRTRFADEGGRAVQILGPPAPFLLPMVDLADLPEPLGNTEARRLAAEESARPFDLRRGGLLRATLLRFGAEEHGLLATMHHIVSDGWSVGVLTRELGLLYRGTPLPELPVQYADYARWQRRWLTGEMLERELGFWRENLTGAATLDLPADHPRPSVQTFRGAGHPFVLPEVLVRGLAAIGQPHGATLFMSLLAGFVALLQRYTGQDDLSLGTPVAGRNRAELEPLIGFFVNTLVLRHDTGGNPSFHDLLGRVRQTSLAAFAHQEVPFERIVEEVQPERDLSRTPLFQVLFVLQNATTDAVSSETQPIADNPADASPLSRGQGGRWERGTGGEVGGWGPLGGIEVAAKFDLTLTLTETPDGGPVLARFDYNVDLFAPATIARMADHWLRLLTAAVADPERPTSELPLLSEAESRQILDDWGRGPAPLPETSVVRLFEAQAARAPDAPAVIFLGEILTYGELNARANRLARHLRRQGIGAEDRIAVCCDRSLELPVGFLGALKAGAAYLPLDPSYPAERLALMLEDAGIRHVLIQERARPVVEELPAAGPFQLHSLDAFPDPTEGESEENLAEEPAPDQAAYVIYTSGSTGRPKGVIAVHRGLASFVRAIAAAVRLGPGDRFLQFASLAFDASVLHLYTPLTSGAAVVLHPLPTVLAPAELLAYAAEQRATALDLPPALWRQALADLADAADRAAPVPPMRAFMTGGDALPREVLAQWSQISGLPEDTRFHSSYGPTEATVVVSLFAVDQREAAAYSRPLATLGRPLAGVEIRLLDRAFHPVPVGAVGEIHLGGVGVTRGYLGRPDLTAASYLPDAWGSEPGARLYHTGDLARWLGDGSLEFLGRADHQVKIRGFRIELGEIEAALAAHPVVEQAVVIARENLATLAGTARRDRRLVAYLVLDSGRSGIAVDSVVAADLRAFLKERLPEPLVPSHFVLLESLPLTANGKLDRRALPRPEAAYAGDVAGDAAGFIAPRPGVEETLAAVWSRLLGAERVGSRDHFFELGGHSLLATQLISRIRDVFGAELPLRTVFEAPTLEGLARAIKAARREATGTAVPPVVPVPREGDFPLSFSQERLWFLEQLQPGRPTFNLPTAVRLGGRLDVAALEGAFGELTRRHEALRTGFPVSGGRPVQAIAPPSPFRLTLVDLSGLDAAPRDTESRRLTQEESRRPFDLARGPLLRAFAMRLAPEEHLTVATMHHIVSDGWSMGLFLRELSAAYRAFAAGEPPRLPELPVQYADYAYWQRAWLEGPVLEAQMESWRRQLRGAPPTLELPTDRPRPAVDPYRGAHFGFSLPRAATEALEAMGRQEEATLFMTLLAAFAAVLGRLSGQQDLTVGSPIAGRNRAEVEGLIGFFVNTLVMRVDLAGDPSFRELLRRVRAMALDAYANQEVPFEKLVVELQPERALNRTPLFQAMFVLQGAPAAASLEAGDLTFQAVQAYNETAQFDLLLTLTRFPMGINGFLEYKPDLFEQATVARWLESLRRLLEGAAADPGRRLSGLPFLSAPERHQMVWEWNDTRSAFGAKAGLTLHELFLAQAERTPRARALLWRGGAIQYGELADRVRGLARHFAALGLRPGGRAAIFMETSPERVAAVLAVLAAGGVYVPIESAHPQERREHMLRDSEAALLLTQERLLAGCETALPTVAVDRLWTGSELADLASGGGALSREAGEGRGGGPDAIAYLLYTSGSTGRPKGVMVRHAAAVNTVLDVNRRFHLTARDRVFSASALTFDLSVWEHFGTLAAGAALVLPEPAPKPDPAAWSEALARHGVTVWNSAPPLLELVVALGDRRSPSLPPTLRCVMLSGDWIPVPLAGQVRRQVPDVRFVSLGGVTEASIWSTGYVVDEVDPAWTSIPYGRPLDNQTNHLLDDLGDPVPLGAVGELCYGGAGVGNGYLHRPDLTAERFRPDPFTDDPGARLYRTGDLSRYRVDGVIEFLGRRDSQLKVRGFRVELGEIESVLLAHPAIREAVVVARREEGRPRSDQRLVAYVVADITDVTDLRTWLAARLPEAMIPSAFVPLERLPLSPNGKIDRKALPDPGEARPVHGPELVEPRDSVEEALVGIWKDLLRVERVGVFDNFFELGGHSLLATRVLAAIREGFGVELELRVLFEKPVLADLALAVAGARVQQADAGEVARLLENLEGLSDEQIEALLASGESSVDPP